MLMVFRFSAISGTKYGEGGFNFSYEDFVFIRVPFSGFVDVRALFSAKGKQYFTICYPMDISRVLYQDREEPASWLVQASTYMSYRVLMIPAKDNVLADRCVFQVI